MLCCPLRQNLCLNPKFNPQTLKHMHIAIIPPPILLSTPIIVYYENWEYLVLGVDGGFNSRVKGLQVLQNGANLSETQAQSLDQAISGSVGYRAYRSGPLQLQLPLKTMIHNEQGFACIGMILGKFSIQ